MSLRHRSDFISNFFFFLYCFVSYILLRDLSYYVIPICFQVSQLRVENSALLKRLTDLNQKYNTASVDNRILKADVETLRAKVSCLISLGNHVDFYSMHVNEELV